MSEQPTAGMGAACRSYHRATERHVRARKDYRCEWCGEPIPKGSDHVIATEFPGGEAGYADSAGRPVRWRICAAPPCHYCSTPPASGDTTGAGS